MKGRLEKHWSKSLRKPRFNFFSKNLKKKFPPLFTIEEQRSQESGTEFGSRFSTGEMVDDDEFEEPLVFGKVVPLERQNSGKKGYAEDGDLLMAKSKSSHSNRVPRKSWKD